MEETTGLTPLRVLPSPAAIGDYLAEQLLQRFEHARRLGKRFLLGCPTGRTPRPIYEEITRHQRDVSHVVLVMMDEYVPSSGEPWSCHAFAQRHMSWNAEVWFPDPNDPAAYDQRIADAGGIDFFLLASGATDGHVAFNQPGAARDSRTRVVPLSEATRRDNLKTSPAFGSLENVPPHGVTVGIATIAAAREAAMVVWGESKRLTLQRIRAADRYDPAWPATVIHECPIREIVCDKDSRHPERSEGSSVLC
ncbi:MAG TPA: 6-phosphogluconolactonase [Gemmatimonadaceae bacterium]|nr:6-phosphogluconolactonase [Gemmatimonadaceae bacterium]